jgi:hypothetical protein
MHAMAQLGETSVLAQTNQRYAAALATRHLEGARQPVTREVTREDTSETSVGWEKAKYPSVGTWCGLLYMCRLSMVWMDKNTLRNSTSRLLVRPEDLPLPNKLERDALPFTNSNSSENREREAVQRRWATSTSHSI